MRDKPEGNHQSDFNWKVWMVGNRVDIMGYSKFQDQKGPASGGGAGVSLNHAWVGFGAGHQTKKGCNDSREMSVNVLLNVMGYASPFPKHDQEIEIEFDPEAPAEVNLEPVPQVGHWQQQQQDAPVAAAGCSRLQHPRHGSDSLQSIHH